jgi:hypothetical protein
MDLVKLAKANMDHYNNHPVQHNIITAVYGVAAVVAINKLSQRIAGVKKYL